MIQVLGEKILGSYNRLSTISASNISSERHADTETVMVVTDTEGGDRHADSL